MSHNTGPFIDETRYCPHLMRCDDYCIECEIEERDGTIETLRARVGNAVEILDSIRALLNGERHPDDAEQIVAMINGFLAQVRKP